MKNEVSDLKKTINMNLSELDYCLKQNKAVC